MGIHGSQLGQAYCQQNECLKQCTEVQPCGLISG